MTMTADTTRTPRRAARPSPRPGRIARKALDAPGDHPLASVALGLGLWAGAILAFGYPGLIVPALILAAAILVTLIRITLG